MEEQLHSGQTLILWTQSRKISYLWWQNRKFLHFCSCGEIKNNTCIVSRQRQLKITQKGSRFASVLQIAFSKKPPNVVPHHVFVILSLVTMFKVQYIFMKALALILWVSSHVLLEFVKMRVKDMDFERHSPSHFDVIFYESLNQLRIVFSWLPRKPWTTAAKLFHAVFCFLFSSLANSSHSMIFLICGPTMIPALTFASESFRKKNWRWKIAWWGLTWCTMVASALSKVLSAAPTWRCSSPQRTRSVVASPFCDSAL